MQRLIVLAAAVLVVPVVGAAKQAATREHPAIRYASQPSTDRIAKLNWRP
jgi:hypothetical protein